MKVHVEICLKHLLTPSKGGLAGGIISNSSAWTPKSSVTFLSVAPTTLPGNLLL